MAGLFLCIAAQASFSQEAIEVSSGLDQEYEWHSPQEVTFRIRHSGTAPLVVAVQEQGFDLKLVTNGIAGLESSIDLSDTTIGWEYLALTPQEASDQKVTVSSARPTNSHAAFRLRILEADNADYWHALRAVTAGAIDLETLEDKSAISGMCRGADTASEYAWKSACLGQAAALLADAGDRNLSTYIMYLLGQLEYRQRNSDKAKQYYQQAISAGSDASVGGIMAKSGYAAIHKAKESSRDLEIFEGIDRDLETLIADDPSNIGLRYYRRDNRTAICLHIHLKNRFAEALECYEKVMAATPEGQDHLRNELRNNKAGLMYQSGQVSEAEAVWLGLLAEGDRINDEQRGFYLNNAGLASWRQRKLSDAINWFEQAREVRHRIQDHYEYMRSTYFLARVYSDLNRPEKANLLLDEVETLAEQLDSPVWKHRALYQKAILRNFLGHIEESLAYFEKAQQVITDEQLEISDTDGRLLRWVEALLAAGHYDQARELLERTTEEAEAYDLRTFAYRSLLKGRIEFHLNDYFSATESFDKASELFNQSEDGYWAAVGTAWLARVNASSGKYEQAIKLVELAINQAGNIRSELLHPDLRAGYSAQQRQIFEAAVTVNLQAWQETNEHRYLLAAFVFAEQSKAQTLLEETKERKQRKSITRSVWEKREKLSAALNGASMSLHTSIGRRHEPAVIAEISKNYYLLLRELESFDREHGLVVNARNSSGKPDLHSIQLDGSKDEVVLSYFLLGDNLLRFEKSGNGLSVASIPIQDGKLSSRKLLKYLRRPGGYRTREYREARDRLSDLLLPAELFSQSTKQLRISADGWLWSIPYSVLQLETETDNEKELIDEFRIVYTPSLFLSNISKTSRNIRESARLSAIVFADPIFSPSDSRVSASTVNPASSSQMGLGRLPGTLREANWIASMDGVDAELKLGSFANRSNLLRLNGESPDILHIATHGLFSQSATTIGGLALSRFNEQGAELDWFVSPQDILGLDLPAELVFMSACDTAKGEEIRGEGVVGITRAFQYAGAENIVSSTWKVSDRGTLAFVSSFYERYVKSGGDAAAALANAAREMKLDTRFKDPYYWSGFALHGSGVRFSKDNT